MSRSEHEPGSWADRHPEQAIARVLASIPASIRYRELGPAPEQDHEPDQLNLLARELRELDREP